MKSLYLVALLSLLTSCAGYHFRHDRNPLAQYEIETLVIPTFVNKSTLPGAGPLFSAKFRELFSNYEELKVLAGDKKYADAILLGIISSPELLRDTVKMEKTQFPSGNLEGALGNRAPYYLPASSRVQLSLRIVIIKRFTQEDIVQITEGKWQLKDGFSRIVLDESFSLSSSFSQVLAKGHLPDEEGVLNFTKNQGLLENSVEQMALSASKDFKELVLNAF